MHRERETETQVEFFFSEATLGEEVVDARGQEIKELRRNGDFFKKVTSGKKEKIETAIIDADAAPWGALRTQSIDRYDCDRRLRVSIPRH